MTVKWDASTARAAIERAAMRGVLRGAEAVRTEAVRLIHSPPKTGRIYRRRGVKHQASAPGEAPASDTGQLAMRTEVIPDTSRVAAQVVFNAAYAGALEQGTERMEPRPYARPALAHKLQEVEADVAEEIRAELGG